MLSNRGIKGAEEERRPDQVPCVRVRQQQQQQRQGHGQQLPGGVAQSSAEHGPLPEEAQLVGDLQDQRRRGKEAAINKMLAGLRDKKDESLIEPQVCQSSLWPAQLLIITLLKVSPHLPQQPRFLHSAHLLKLFS